MKITNYCNSPNLSSYSTRCMMWVFIGALLPFIIVELFRFELYSVMKIDTYLVFHNIAEGFSIIVSFSIFGVGWYTYEQSQNQHALFLGVIFLAVGLLDSIHTLGYAGMPALITPNSPIKSTQYWIAARLFMSIAFLASAYVYPASCSRWLSKNVLLSIALTIPMLVFITVTFFPDYVPKTIVEGVGLTPFKKNSEYLIITLLCVSIVVYWKRMLKTNDSPLLYFLAAFVICIFGEAVFAGYKSVFDTYNVVGHVYKIIAFYLIYKGLFETAVKNPYFKLAAVNEQLRDEIIVRIETEQALENYRNGLEALVTQRTSELELAKNAAEAANHAKSIFLANMSHELRTPLNAILGFSELMSQDDIVTIPQKKTLGIINRSGAHLLSMINDVLDISKIEAGRLELDMQPFDLVKLLQDIGEMISVRAETKQLAFQLEIAPDTPQFVQTDNGKLRQIIINLLGNAIKFTSEGTVVLRARSQCLSETETLLNIDVIDSGVGILASQQEELFKPFVQLIQDNTDVKGTGLGLAISKSLIELMGGEISFSSVFGEGSTFKIALPVMLANASDIVEEENYQLVKRVAPNQLAWRLLVVDDNADSRLLLATFLSKVGFDVREAENGQEAIDIFTEWQPHLIWMDMRMPVMDGYEATQKIRQLSHGDKVKIIALTASVFREQHYQIIDAGCDAVLHKPFHIPEIFTSLIKYLGVKFVYREVETTDVLPVLKMTAEMLATLPSELRQQLHEAALKLDIEEIDSVISQIHPIAFDIAKGLDALAKGYQFEQIIHLLNIKN